MGREGKDMSRNYGLGHRDMKKAGALALERARENKQISFSTESKYEQSWSQFAGWAKGEGIGRMEHVTPEAVMRYGRGLADQVSSGDMAPATAQNLVSAVNRVMTMASGRWESISPTKDCGIDERSRVREGTPATLDRAEYEACLADARSTVSDRAASVCELARELGLRSKEASLFDARAALKEAHEKGAVSVSDGTKGGRDREVPITSSAQLGALERAAAAQGDARAVMPADRNWKQWSQGELREVSEAMGGLHELRAAYACERYESLTGHAAPCSGGQILDRQADEAARQQVSSELGHGRIDVVSEYVGGRK